MKSDAVLEVWLNDQLAGKLLAERGQMKFQYENDWVIRKQPPLSQSLPVRQDAFEGERVHSFFSNLLPEGEIRQIIARRFGVSVGNDFALLSAVGGDCAGAISLIEPGHQVSKYADDDVRWLDDQQLGEAIAQLPTRPLLSDPDEGIRLSLAGAQDKLPIVFRDGRFGIPLERMPSTHILKTPIARFDDTVVNEAYCMQFTSAMGQSVAPASVYKVGEKEILLVERYDRTRDDKIQRIHQEDFCQALGVAPENKYQSEGGPGLVQCVDLIRQASTRPAPDLLRFVDAVIINFLIGNHDAHAKNFSLLYRSEVTELAPLYDLICTVVYPGLTRKMAMQIGNEYRAQYVRRRHFERFAREADLGTALLIQRALAVTERAEETAKQLAASFREQGFDRPVLERVLTTIMSRVRQLETELRS